jgi:hypothetical protein
MTYRLKKVGSKGTSQARARRTARLIDEGTLNEGRTLVVKKLLIVPQLVVSVVVAASAAVER